ncbi:MAG: hypothetical protein DLM60_22660 [Pseudonocardiales bacterium]|nr:MAG: hypothetical protein DLM60_22660 [Pseudonocardiales bacterium]
MSCRAADAAGECVGRVVVDEHSETCYPVWVEHPTAPLPVADDDHGALTAAVDAAAFHRTPFLLTIWQVMRPVQFQRLLHCYLSSLTWYVSTVYALW